MAAAGVASCSVEVVTFPVRMPAFFAFSRMVSCGLPSMFTPMAPL